MRINSINFNYHKPVNFKGSNDDFFNDLIYSLPEIKSSDTADTFEMGTGDEFGSEQRNVIREHYMARNMPYYNYYEKGRLNSYELGSLTRGLNRQGTVDNERINNLNIINIKQIGENMYRGRSLVTHPEYLSVLHDEGVERLIDLAGYTILAKECKKYGIEYMSFRMNEDFWENSAFKNIEAEIRNKQRRLELLGTPFEQMGKVGRDMRAAMEIQSRKFIYKLINMFHFLNNGNLYIGCDYGQTRTDAALMLSDLFNGNAKGVYYGSDKLLEEHKEELQELYKKLRKADKEELGFTPEFEKKLREKLSIK